MICRIRAKNYRALWDIDQRVAPFQILIGPNGGGKSTFLDVPRFLADFVQQGATKAVLRRASYFAELTYQNHGGEIELEVELILPEDVCAQTANGMGFIRYAVTLEASESGTPNVKRETLTLHPENDESKTRFVVVREMEYGQSVAHFYRETKAPETDPGDLEASRGDWRDIKFRLASNDQSALAALPKDPERLPAALWALQTLTEWLQVVQLDVDRIRQAASPLNPDDRLLLDGSNLALIVKGYSMGVIQHISNGWKKMCAQCSLT